MKINNIIVFALTVLLMVGCSKNEIFNFEGQNTDNGRNIRVTAKDFIWDTQISKSSVEVNEDGVKFKWVESDTIGIFPSNGFQVAFPMSSGAGSNCAEFNGGDWKLRESALYVAYYPFDFNNRSGKNIAISYLGQVQDGNDNTDHIGKYDYLAASAKTPENGAVSFNFNHLGALIRFTLKIKEASELTSLTIETDEPLFVRNGSLDLMSSFPKIAAEEKFTRVSMELTNIKTTTVDEEVIIYMMMAPADLSGKTVNVSLSRSGENIMTYEFAGKNFEAGKAYSLSSSEVKYEDPHLQIADFKGKAIGYEGGILNLSYLSNLECEYFIDAEAQSWIEPIGTKVISNRTTSFRIKENHTGSSRRGIVTIKSLRSNIAIEYAIIQGFKGAYAVTEDCGLMPQGILYVSHQPIDSEHGIERMVDNDLTTFYHVDGSNFDIMWEGPYPIGISEIGYGLSANTSEIQGIEYYCSDNGKDWVFKGGFGRRPHSKQLIMRTQNLSFIRARFFKFNITSNHGASTTMVPEFRFNIDSSMDSEIKTFQDLLAKGTRLTHSTQTPMGKHYENRHVTTDEDRKWLLNPENEPALLQSASRYTYRTFDVNLYPFGTPQPADVNQRGIGDCCAMAVFAQMAYMFPDFIKSIITDHNDGTYTVKMFDPQGLPVDVKLKSTFLCDDSGLGATAGKDGKANWATIMEKAIMKWNFIYQVNPDIGGIGTEVVVPLFTGNGDSFAILPNMLLSDNLQRAVNISLQNNMIVVGGFNKGGLSVGGPSTVTLHAYSFMYSTHPEALFAVRNPWGHNTGYNNDDGVMHVMDDGIVPPTIDIRVVYPGAAEPYAIQNLGPYQPPQYKTRMMYNHTKQLLEKIEE